MKQRCRVMIPAQAPETRQSKILFKTEWASLLMNAQKKEGERGMPFHEVTGDLLELQGDMGIVTLEGICHSTYHHFANKFLQIKFLLF